MEDKRKQRPSRRAPFWISRLMGINGHRDGLRNDQDDPFQGRCFVFNSPSRIVQEEGVVPMRIPRWLPGPLILGTVIGGCSQTGSFRQPESGEVRTTASVGDKPVSIATGIADDGGSARAEERASYNPRTSEGRISGRVYDERNDPVANARVRLAVGGEPGGKAVFATTDRSGAFTLRGLRPGSNYTLIAEYQGEEGMMSGRADADAPETGVRIGLHPRDAGGGGDRVLASRPSGSRLTAISRAEERDDEAWDEEEPPAHDARARHNQEDLAPPVLDDFGEAADDFQDDGAAPARSSRRPRGVSRSADEMQDDWDDEENPLPPARELGDLDIREPDRASQTRVARAGVDDADELPPAAELESESDPRSKARTLRPEAFAPIMIDDPEPYPSRFETAPPARNRSDEPAKREPPSLEPKRPTWGEVVSQHQEIPVDESLMRTTAASEKAEDLAASDPDRPTSSVAAAQVDEEQNASVDEHPASGAKRDDREPLIKRKPGPYCEYDAAERRVIDLGLPDVSGRMVSIRDFDADLILLDFWGTWCLPCRKSIPHLKELQDKLGGKKLQVVGIACERTPDAERAAKVAEVVNENDINYAVLVTGMDAACPVQEALAIQFYPTMILLDREGRVLLREQGATDASLARVDRAIARHLDRDKPSVAAEDGDGAARR